MSRILSYAHSTRRCPQREAAIHLGAPSLGTSSGLPVHQQASSSRTQPHGQAVQLLDLAPGGVYLATPVTWRAGALLPHLFTLTREAGGLFSVALSRRSPWVAVSNHRALWSPDFPRRAASSQRGIGSSSPRPPGLLGRCLLYLRAGPSPKTRECRLGSSPRGSACH